MHYTVTVRAQTTKLVKGGFMLVTHIGDVDGMMMDFDTGRTTIPVSFDRIRPALFAEKPAMFLDE